MRIICFWVNGVFGIVTFLIYDVILIVIFFIKPPSLNHVTDNVKITKLSDKISIYPVPAKDILHLVFLNENIHPESIKIYDLNGKCLINQKVYIPTTNIEVNRRFASVVRVQQFCQRTGTRTANPHGW